MLVLSRRESEQIQFPNLGITVRLLRIRGNVARLGIEAPRDVAVVRGELTSQHAHVSAAPPDARERLSHELANRLSKVNLSLHLFRQQQAAGHFDAAQRSLDQALAALAALDRDWIEQQFETSSPSVASAGRTSKTGRILLVDDDVNERELLAGVLSMNGDDCVAVEDGQRALEYLASHELPDVVLLDMWMPRCDGATTLRTIRSNPRWGHLPVFSVSSTCPEEVGLSLGADGFDAWFPKPLDPTRLCQAIHQAIVAHRN